MEDDEVVEVLVGLGLSFLEAKIYFSMLKFECKPTTVKVVSSIAEVVRQDTYRILADLHRRGIVEKVLTNPTTYKCIPLERGISKLLSERSEEYFNAKKKSELVLKNYKSSIVKKQEDENLHFSLTANMDLFLQKMRKETNNTNYSIEMIYAREKMSVITFHMLEDIKAALDRGVKVNLIMTSLLKVEFEKNLRELQKTDSLYENLEIRYIKKRPKVGLAIFDKNKCFIRITPSLGDSLFTTNENVVALAGYYFNSVWQNGLLEGIE